MKSKKKSFPHSSVGEQPACHVETWVRSLGWENPLEKGKATHSSILAWRILYSPWGHKESDTTERLSKKKDTNELIYKVETDSHRKGYEREKGVSEGKIRSLGLTDTEHKINDTRSYSVAWGAIFKIL